MSRKYVCPGKETLLQQVHAAEEGLEVGIGAQP